MRAAVGAEPLSDSVSIDTLDDDDLILLGLGLCVNPAGFEKLDDAGGRWSVHRTDDGAIVLRWDES